MADTTIGGQNQEAVLNGNAPQELDGRGDPILNEDTSGVGVVYGAPMSTSSNKNSPKEVQNGGVGDPTNNNDNVGTDVSYGAKAAIFTEKTSPTEIAVDGPLLEVFDNKSKNVFSFPDPRAPVGNTKESNTFTSPVNYDY